jgi:hypothetical protein
MTEKADLFTMAPSGLDREHDAKARICFGVQFFGRRSTPNERWSLDFVSDQLTDGRRFAS